MLFHMVNSVTCMNIGTSLEKAINSVYQIIRKSLSEDNLKNTKSLAYLLKITTISVKMTGFNR